MVHGDAVWSVWRGVCLFSSCVVHNSSWADLAVTTIWLQQVTTGLLTGTLSITPSSSYLSNPALTAAFQWSGTVLGVWIGFCVYISINLKAK